MSKQPCANLLLVEGTTDALVANHLADWYGIPDCYDYLPYEGIDSLLRALPYRLKESGRKRVAVVVDADSDVAVRWQSVRDRLAPLGYAVSRSPDATGSIIGPPHSGLPRVGVWVMPDNCSPGILEHFLQSLVRAGDAMLPLVREAVACIPPELRQFPAPHQAKAEIYTWLAWQEKSGCSFGPAIKSGLLDGNHALAGRFVDWVRRLFDVQPVTVCERPHGHS